MSAEQHRMRRAHLRAATKQGRHYTTLRPIAPGVVDDYGSLWNPHAFDTSLSERLPALVWSHLWHEPIGRGVDFTPSDRGPTVRFEFSDFEHVPTAAKAFSLVSDGTITDCSVGFSGGVRRPPTADEKSRHPDAREVVESARLDEVSLVLRGAVPGAEVLSVRHARRMLPYTPETERLRADRAQGKISVGEYRQALAEVRARLADDEQRDAMVPLLARREAIVARLEAEQAAVKMKAEAVQARRPARPVPTRAMTRPNMDFVVELAKRVTAGTMSHDAARALVWGETRDPEMADLDAAVDEALAVVAERR